MPDTGWVLAGQGRAVNRPGGVTAWSNPNLITGDDGLNATVVPATGFSHWLVGDQFDFSSLPSNAIIQGVDVRAQLGVNVVVFSPAVSAVNIGKSDAVLGTQKNPATALTTTPTNYDYGGAADLWGLPLSAAEVKASTFQALISVAIATGGAVTFSCDAIWMRVTYIPAPSPIFLSNSFLPFLVR